MGMGEGGRRLVGRQHLLLTREDPTAPACLFIDIDRFAEEVAAINRAPPRIALLYSQPSIFWEGKYAGAIHAIYTHLNFLGAEDDVCQRADAPPAPFSACPGVQWILLSQATHVEDATVAWVAEDNVSGGKLIHAGEGNLAFDQYHRKLNVPGDLAGGPAVRKLDFQKECLAASRSCGTFSSRRSY